MTEQEVQEKPIQWFSESAIAPASQIGTLGRQLSILYGKKFSVPPGFVITTYVCQTFLQENEIMPEIEALLKQGATMQHEELVRRSERLKERIKAGKFSPALQEAVQEAYGILNTDVTQTGLAKAGALAILKNSYEPPFVAVRSSALEDIENFTAYSQLSVKFSNGQLPRKEDIGHAIVHNEHPAFMNVKGNENLMEAVKACYQSLVTPEHIREAALASLPFSGIAVIIQIMIDADISGIITPKGEDGFIIEAVWGLGQLLTEKKIEGDRYEVRKELGLMVLKETRVGGKEYAMTRDASGKNIIVQLTENRRQQTLLTAADAQRLAKIAEMVIQSCQESQRITFALTRGTLHILSCRAYNGLEEKPSSKVMPEVEEMSAPVESETVAEHLPDTQPSALIAPPLAASASGLLESFGRIGLMSEHAPIIYHPLVSGISSDEVFHALVTLAYIAPVAIILPGHLSSIRLKQVHQTLEAVRRLSSLAPHATITALVPHVTQVHHFTDVSNLAKALGVSSSVKFGVRIETPAAVQLMGKLCDAGITHVEFDLAAVTQHLLARRTPARTRDLFSPAVLTALNYIHRRAERAGIHVSVSLPSTLQASPAHLDQLAAQGVYAYSVTPLYGTYMIHLLGIDLHWHEPYAPERAALVEERLVEDIEAVVLRELSDANEDEHQPESKSLKQNIPPLNDAMSADPAQV